MSDAIELTTENFESSIKKGEWVVDFWASWCVAPDTQIYHSPFHSKAANSIQKNDSIISFNQGLSQDRIIHSHTSRKNGHCKQITTSAGRVIKTTDDHAFFTKRGWIAADQLTKEDKVAILPVVDAIPFIGEENTLIDEDTFISLHTEYKNIKMYSEELKEKNLLPLKKDDPRILILSRIIGALFSDGSLYKSKKNNYREISFCLGQKEDVNHIVSDLSALGFGIIHISERTNEHNIEGRAFTMHTFKVKCLSTALYLLLSALGAPQGNKTNTVYSIPSWIQKGERAIKREFLSAYLGGDGPRVSLRVTPRKGKNPYNSININDLEFRKRVDLAEKGVQFAYELSSLLQEFGITQTQVFYEIDPYLRKDNTRTAIIHISFPNNFKTGFILTQQIGYSYCSQKQSLAFHAGEFLRELLQKRNSWEELHRKVMVLKEKGDSYQEVSSKLSIAPLLAYQWMVKSIKPTVKKHYLKFDTWLAEATESLRDGFVWENVDLIETVHLPQVQVIETEKHHNFIANGFLVHNCGPCKMMAPEFEAAARELKGKVNFGKVNVEDHFELSDKFNIMSIPTTMFFKNGKMVGAHTGALSKDEILKLVKENL
ncbi:MAG: thioredoxin domain-containing protein [Nanoarchaeota archaeon]